MRGGIVWRLAYEDVDPQRVLLGPSDSWRKQVQVLGDVAYEDDTLSEEELFVICGVYRIYAGKLTPTPYANRAVTAIMP